MKCGTPQRQIVAQEPPAQFVEQFDPVVDKRTFDQQPARNLSARDRFAEAGIGPFGAEELFAAGSGRRLGGNGEEGRGGQLDYPLQKFNAARSRASGIADT
jgi:hypothetical protein